MNIETVDDGRSRRWDIHRAERRRELVKVAIEAIDELGPSASMEDIATAAKTSKSVFYRYFKDKAGLQEAVADRVLRRVRRELLAATELREHPRDVLRSTLDAYLRLIERSPNVYSFVTQDFTSEEIRGFFASVIAMISDTLGPLLNTGGEENDDVASTPADPLAAATLRIWPQAAVGMIRSAAEAWLYSPADTRPSLEEMRDLLTGWVTCGIRLPQDNPRTSPRVHLS